MMGDLNTGIGDNGKDGVTGAYVVSVVNESRQYQLDV